MRVIAGIYGGRRLQCPSGLGTRPTTDRVREALFNVLRDDVAGKHVLDLYSGSGALGIEALSRQAASVVFVEHGKEASKVIQANLTSLGLMGGQKTHLLAKDIERCIRELKALGPFDLWLVDPPFASVRDGASQQLLGKLVGAGLLGPGGLVVLEYPTDQDCPTIEGLQAEGVRVYGDSSLAFYRNIESGNN